MFRYLHAITLTKLQEIETEKLETKKALKKSNGDRSIIEVTPSQKRELEAKISTGQSPSKKKQRV